MFDWHEVYFWQIICLHPTLPQGVDNRKWWESERTTFTFSLTSKTRPARQILPILHISIYTSRVVSRSWKWVSIFVSFWILTHSQAALLPTCLCNGRTTDTFISQLRDIARFGGKTSYRLANRSSDFLSDWICMYLPGRNTELSQIWLRSFSTAEDSATVAHNGGLLCGKKFKICDFAGNLTDSRETSNM